MLLLLLGKNLPSVVVISIEAFVPYDVALIVIIAGISVPDPSLKEKEYVPLELIDLVISSSAPFEVVILGRSIALTILKVFEVPSPKLKIPFVIVFVPCPDTSAIPRSNATPEVLFAFSMVINPPVKLNAP